MSIFSPLDHAGFSWVLQAALLSVSLLILASFAVRRRLAGADRGVVPDQGISIRNVFEVLVESDTSGSRNIS